VLWYAEILPFKYGLYSFLAFLIVDIILIRTAVRYLKQTHGRIWARVALISAILLLVSIIPLGFLRATYDIPLGYPVDMNGLINLQPSKPITSILNQTAITEYYDKYEVNDRSENEWFRCYKIKDQSIFMSTAVIVHPSYERAKGQYDDMISYFTLISPFFLNSMKQNGHAGYIEWKAVQERDYRAVNYNAMSLTHKCEKKVEFYNKNLYVTIRWQWQKGATPEFQKDIDELVNILKVLE
jgi:hypothetical protein